MASILIAYGTTDRHTAKVVEAVADTLRAAGCQVNVITGEGLNTDFDRERYDGVVVAASVHAGGYQREVGRWVRRNRRGLNRRPGLFLSVCLAVLDRRPEVQAEVRGVMDRFLEANGWRATVKKLVPGALLYTRYGWLKRRIMQRIARKAGGDTDVTRDYEYTDWGELRATAQSFATLVERTRAIARAAGERQKAGRVLSLT